MDEVKTKIFNIDPIDTQKKLLALGAVQTFCGEAKSIYFNHTDININRRICLSQENGTQKISVKEIINGDSKDGSLFHTITVSNLQSAKQLLEAIGFRADIFTVKKRRSFVLDLVTFSLDKYTGSLEHIPDFIKINAENENSLNKYVELLGFSKSQMRDWDLEKLDAQFSEEN